MTMTCAVRDTVLPKSKGVRVNGVAIARDLIAREIQNHPARNPTVAWAAAARALVVRELLLQEARRLAIVGTPKSEGDRRETDEEAAIRTLVEREVMTPTPDAASCRRFYDNNTARFRSTDLFAASHILIAADACDSEAFAAALERTSALCTELRAHPQRFGDLARTYSDCPSAAQGGNLGQVGAGDTTPEFEAALRQLAAGEITSEPVTTRYGCHVIRLERRLDGRVLPFEAVADQIAAYLADRVERLAVAQYIARLAGRATVEGVTLADADALRVH
jgi:peptidyl-prolyl cis-trans isomerase C